ncbi:hypothetical protein GJ496_009329 [Pomphorhynchus laevis]|nr:hypothetical protein GJ496_009329 [Pomphorhynchus laevis]
MKPIRLYSAATVSKTDNQFEDNCGISLPHQSDYKNPSENVSSIADQIVKLNLIELTELRQILQRKLNLSDSMLMPSVAAGTLPSSGGAASDAAEDDESVSKTSFTLQLKGFEDNKKVALIKEIRNIMPDMNLVQAKKFVESLPHVVLENVGKDEAEKVMKQLEALGGICLLE